MLKCELPEFQFKFLFCYDTGKVTSMWSSFRRRTSTQASFPIGAYRIDASIAGVLGLREWSATEYAQMGERQFAGEKNYNAPPVDFLGQRWILQLGTVNDRIYKIAAYLTFRDKWEANPVAMDALRHCVEMLGEPTSQETGLFLWNTTDGNVVLQTAETAAGLAINLFVTSRAVRTFTKS